MFEFLANDIRGDGVCSTNFTEFVEQYHVVIKEEYGVWDNKKKYSKRRNSNGYSKMLPNLKAPLTVTSEGAIYHNLWFCD